MRAPRLSPVAYRRITLGAYVALAVIVVTGAAVRLTGSGLGCPDWPTCYEDQFHAAGEFHAMVEYLNRLFTGVVALSVILAVAGSLVRRPRRRDLVGWSLGLVAGVVAQVIVGGITVLTHLTPTIVMTHFLLSMVLLWNAIVLFHRAGAADDPDRPGRAPAGRPRVAEPVRWAGRVIMALATVVVFTGTIVTASGPHGGDERVERLGFFLPDVARVHGSSVVALVAATVVTLWLLRRHDAPPDIRRNAWWLLGVLVANAAVGYTQYFTGVPEVLVAVHIVGAIAVWTAAVLFVLSLTGRGPSGAPAVGAPAQDRADHEAPSVLSPT